MARALPRTRIGLILDAATAAMRDAGLAVADIDGVLTLEPNAPGEPPDWVLVAEQLGFRLLRLCTGVAMGGASSGFLVELARSAIATGRCRNVLIFVGVKWSDRGVRSLAGSGATNWMSELPHHSPTYEQPFGSMIPALFAVMARRHMHEFGTTSEQLAAVAVACRKHAAMNPNAVMRQPITIQDVLSSRMIVSPFHLLDCSITNDGASAFVVSSAEQARSSPHPPVWLIGGGFAQSAYFTGTLARGDGTYDIVRTVGKAAAEMAFGEAGVTRDNIDVAELYDMFTSVVITQLEDYGFCAKGEGGPFVENGAVEVGGRIPVNTHGGHMSGTMMVGFSHYPEAVRQLRGNGGERQVKDAKLALVSSAAGVASTFSLQILARD